MYVYVISYFIFTPYPISINLRAVRFRCLIKSFNFSKFSQILFLVYICTIHTLNMYILKCFNNTRMCVCVFFFFNLHWEKNDECDREVSLARALFKMFAYIYRFWMKIDRIYFSIWKRLHLVISVFNICSTYFPNINSHQCWPIPILNSILNLPILSEIVFLLQN